MKHTMSMYSSKDQMIEEMQAEIDRLEAELGELRKDKARLDWLADPANMIGNVQLPTHCVKQNPHSLRAAQGKTQGQVIDWMADIERDYLKNNTHK